MQRDTKTIDAADLTPLAHNLLISNQNALVDLRGRLKQLIVDEFQDVSAAQHALLKLVVNGIPNVGVKGFDVPKLFCAGDVDQCIYGWRGSTPTQNIGQFLQDFPQGLVVPCRTNYRLPRSIIDAANHLMKGDNATSTVAAHPPTHSTSEVAMGAHSQQKAFDVSPAALASLRRLLPNPSESIGKEFVDFDSCSSYDKVIVRGFWDAKQEVSVCVEGGAGRGARNEALLILNRFSSQAKALASMINKRYNERKKLLGEGKRNYFDTSDVAVMVRSAEQMTVIAEVLADTRIPFVAEGYAAASRVGNSASKPKITKSSDSLLDSPRSNKVLQILGGCR